MILCATTGIASLNLGEGVTTINALLKFFDTASLTESYTAGLLAARLRKLRRAGLRRIVLDEMSMLDGNQLTCLVRAMDEVNGVDGSYSLDAVGAEQDEAEGLPALALTLVGDFCQLPPVKAPFAFDSPEWERFAPNVTTLTKIYRQSDQEFVAALQACRRGDARTASELLAPQMADSLDMKFDGPTLVATNDVVERVNRLRLDEIKHAADRYTSVRWGEQRPEWKKNIPEVLELKPGALVMVLANKLEGADEGGDDGTYVYVNGDLGIYEGKSSDGRAAKVTLQRTGATELVSPVTREILEPLDPGERKELKAAGQVERIREKNKVVGALTYLPIRVAYATTVHKSQGLSLDKVQIALREHFFSNPGSVYVALSRARSLAGLRIVGNAATLIKRCVADPRVKAWL